MQPTNQTINSKDGLDFFERLLEGAPIALVPYIKGFVILFLLLVAGFSLYKYWQLKQDKKDLQTAENALKNCNDDKEILNERLKGEKAIIESLELKIKQCESIKKDLENTIHTQRNDLQTATLERVELAGLRDRKADIERNELEIINLRHIKIKLENDYMNMQNEVMDLKEDLDELKIKFSKTVAEKNNLIAEQKAQTDHFAERAYIAETKIEMIEKYTGK